MATTPTGQSADGTSGEGPFPPGVVTPAGDVASAAHPGGDEPVADAPDLTPETLLGVSEEVALQFPAPFDETELVLMDVDPRRVHAYWHIAAQDLAAARGPVGESSPAPLVLRVRDVTADGAGPGAPAESFDIEVQGLDGHCYVDLWQGGRAYEAELGLRAPDGTLVALARSNRVETPPGGPAPLQTAVPPRAALQPLVAPGPESPESLAAESQPAGTARDQGPAPSGSEAASAALQETLFGPHLDAPSVPLGAATFAHLAELPSAALQESLFGPPPQAPSVPLGAATFAHLAEVPSAELQENLFGPLPEAPSVPLGEAPFEGAPEAALQAPPGQDLLPEFPNAFPDLGPAGTIAGPGDGGTASQAVDGALLPAFDGGATTAPAGGVTGDAGAASSPDTGVETFVTYSSSALAGSPVLLEVNAELHVYGRARPGSRLQIFGRPVVLRPDGSFSIRRPLPTGAVVLPIQLEDADPTQPGPGEPG
jgi:hypothetical protein